MRSNPQTIVVLVPAGKDVTKPAVGDFYYLLASEAAVLVKPDNSSALKCVPGRGKQLEAGFHSVTIFNPNAIDCNVVLLVDYGDIVFDTKENREAQTFTTSDGFVLADTGFVVVPGQIFLNGVTYRRKRMWLTNLHATLDCRINSLNSFKSITADKAQFDYNGFASFDNQSPVASAALSLVHNGGERVLDGSDKIRLYNPGADAVPMLILCLADWYLIN